MADKGFSDFSREKTHEETFTCTYSEANGVISLWRQWFLLPKTEVVARRTVLSRKRSDVATLRNGKLPVSYQDRSGILYGT